jgi:nitroreductase
MNAIINNILARRSVRQFTEKQISDEILNTILNCGINAPSAMNKQPWAIRVVQNSKILYAINQEFINWAKGKQLQGSASHASEPNFSVFHHSPTLVVVAADVENHYSKGDCGMFAQNVMLAAESLGIGTCVIGNITAAIEHSEHLKKALQIPENYEVMFGIAVGYKAESPDVKLKNKDKVQWIR